MKRLSGSHARSIPPWCARVATLTESRIATLLLPFDPEPSTLLLSQLSTYLDLLLKWNQRTNLTAIRDPEQIVVRHFGESLFTARHLPAGETLLDFGSGAGFPGLPIQLALPALHVTLAESQNKKASFLQEVVRTLALPTRVWAGRVEALPSHECFSLVTLRAVDDTKAALLTAKERLSPDGYLVHLSTTPSSQSASDSILLPAAHGSYVNIYSASTL